MCRMIEWEETYPLDIAVEPPLGFERDVTELEEYVEYALSLRVHTAVHAVGNKREQVATGRLLRLALVEGFTQVVVIYGAWPGVLRVACEAILLLALRFGLASPVALMFVETDDVLHVSPLDQGKRKIQLGVDRVALVVVCQAGLLYNCVLGVRVKGSFVSEKSGAVRPIARAEPVS